MSSKDMYKEDLAEVLRNLSKGTVDLAVKKLYDAIKDVANENFFPNRHSLADIAHLVWPRWTISEEEVNISQAKDKIKFDVYLDIEVPDDTTQKFTEILLLQKEFFNDCVFWKKYEKIDVKVNKDIGEGIINVYLTVIPTNSFTFNINDERVILEILNQEGDFFINSFSFDGFDEKLFLGALKIKIEREKTSSLFFKNNLGENFFSECFYKLIQSKLVKGKREYAKKYKLNVKARFSKDLKN